MNTFRRLTFLVIALALLCSSIPAVYAQDEPAAGNIVYMPAINATLTSDEVDNSLVVAKVISPAEQKAALAFWTREAVAQAQPMAMPVQLGPPNVDELATTEVTGPLGSSPAGQASPAALKLVQAAYPEDWAAFNEAGAIVADNLDLRGFAQHTAHNRVHH